MSETDPEIYIEKIQVHTLIRKKTQEDPFFSSSKTFNVNLKFYFENLFVIVDRL